MTAKIYIKKKDTRNKAGHDERIREMFELYTMLPPSPYVKRKKRKLKIKSPRQK